MGSKDLAEKNLLQYKDVFSDIVNVNLFGGRHYISANELSREPGELITKSSSDNKLKQLQMDVPMKCIKKYNTRFFVCLENQSDINNIMPVRDMGYQHAKYMEQVRTIKETNRQQQTYPSPITKGIHDTQKLDPVITLVLNYSQKEWKKPKQLQDVLNIPDDMRKEFEKWISPHSIGIINLANQSESTMQMYHSDFKYIVRYLSCKNDKEKLESFFRTTDFELDHPEAFFNAIFQAKGFTFLQALRNLAHSELDKIHQGGPSRQATFDQFGYDPKATLHALRYASIFFAMQISFLSLIHI